MHPFHISLPGADSVIHDTAVQIRLYVVEKLRFHHLTVIRVNDLVKLREWASGRKLLRLPARLTIKFFVYITYHILLPDQQPDQAVRNGIDQALQLGFCLMLIGDIDEKNVHRPLGAGLIHPRAVGRIPGDGFIFLLDPVGDGGRLIRYKKLLQRFRDDRAVLRHDEIHSFAAEGGRLALRLRISSHSVVTVSGRNDAEFVVHRQTCGSAKHGLRQHGQFLLGFFQFHHQMIKMLWCNRNTIFNR